MSGSSRSFTRTLSTVLEHWHEGSANSHEVSELFSVIASFHEKHNTLATVRPSTNLNEELSKIYRKYVFSDQNINKELFFLDILRQILPIYDEEEIIPWLKTYLKPCFDSAGYDLQYVSKAREFITALTSNIKWSDDQLLMLRRNKIGVYVVEQVLRIYIGKSADCYSMINLQLSDADKDNQVTYERVRFIERNCADFLQDYGLKNPKTFFTLVNKYFKIASMRLKVLTLLSQVIANQTSRVHEIVNTELFESILASILCDFSESIVLVSLSVLVMVFPQLCDVIADYLPDLLLIYVRISNWKELSESLSDRETSMNSNLKVRSISWDLALFDPSYTDISLTSISQSFANPPNITYPTNSRIELDISYIATFIYGLFPFNFKLFLNKPYQYFVEHPSVFIDMKYITDIDRQMTENGGGSQFETYIQKKTSELFSKFLLHSNFLKPNHTAEDEIKKPLAWLLEQHADEDIVCEEIALACLSLNPELLYTVPDSFVVQRKQDNRSLIDGAVSNSSLESSSGGFVYSGTGSGVSNSGSNHVSRKSSFHGPMYFTAKEAMVNKNLMLKQLQNLNRRVSVVPTNWVIDSSEPSLPSKSSNLGIHFKDVKFDEGLKGSKQSINEEGEAVEESEKNGSEALSGLFSTHQELYAPPFSNDNSIEPSGIQSKRTSIESGSKRTPDTGSKRASIETGSKRASIDPEKHTTEASYNQIKSLMDTDTRSSISHGKSASSLLNDKLRDVSASSPTTSVETTTIHKNSIISAPEIYDPSSEKNLKPQFMTRSQGTALDFYQRELLLMKNELEFSSYMKNLNKFHYIRVKLKMSKLLRESTVHSQSIESRNNLTKLQSIANSYDTLVESLSSMQLEKDELNLKMRQDKVDLTNQLMTLKDENDLLKTNLSSISRENQSINENMAKVIKEEIPEKESEITNLKIKLSDLEEQQEKLAKSQQKAVVEDVEQKPVESSRVNDYEAQIIKLNAEIQRLNGENVFLSKELKNFQQLYEATIKNYESKLTSTKHEIGDEVYRQTIQLEKKIQELSLTLLKYETTLEEKNAKIVQLSTSLPISIPGAITPSGSVVGANDPSLRMYGTDPRNMYGYGRHEMDFVYDHNRSDSSLGTNSSPSINQPAANTLSNFRMTPAPTQDLPILRGRGGYQKRSKKLM